MAWLFRRGSSRSAATAATEQAKREQLQLPASCHKPLHISDFAATRRPKGQAAAPDPAAAEENAFSTSSTEASNKQPSGHSPKEGSAVEFTAADALLRTRAPLLVYPCTAAPSSAPAATAAAAAAPRVFVAASWVSVASEAPVGVAVASSNAAAPPLASSVSHDAAAAVAAAKQGGAPSAAAAPTAEVQPWQPKTATTPATATAPAAATTPATAAATPAEARATAGTTAATPGGTAAATAATTAATGAGAMATAAATVTTVGSTTGTAAWTAQPASAQGRSVEPQLRAAAASVACTAGAAVAPPHATPLVGSEATVEQGATSACAPDGLRCSAAAAPPGGSLPFLTAPSPSCAPASDDRAPHCGCSSVPAAPPGAAASPTAVSPARNPPPDVFNPSLPTASLYATSPQPPTVFPEEEEAAAAAAAAGGDTAAAAAVGVSAAAADAVVGPARQQPYEERQGEGEGGGRRAASVAPPAAAVAEREQQRREGTSETATRLCEPPLSPGNSSRFAAVAACPAAAAVAGMSGALHVDGEAHATAAAPPTQREATRQHCQQEGPLQPRRQDEEEEKQQQGGEEEEEGRRGTQGLHHPGASLFFDYEFYSSLQERSPVASPRAAPGTASPFPVLPKTLPPAAAAAHVTASTTSSSSSSSSSDYSFPCLRSSSSSAPYPHGQVERPFADARPQHAAAALPCTSALQQQQQQQKRNHSPSVPSAAEPQQQQKSAEDCLLTHASAAPEPAMAAPAAAAATAPLAAAHEEFAAATSVHVSSASPSAAGPTAGAAAAAANAAAPCMHYLPADGGGAEPLACRRHHCVHVFPPSELKLFVMEGDAAVAAAAAARREEEETLKHPCPLQLPTHLIYHVYEDMNQWQIDRSVAIEAFHQQQLREAYYVLLCLVKRYGVERVAADRELCLVYHRYTEMRYLLRLLDLDVETDAAAAAACSAAAGAAKSGTEALHALRRHSAGTAASLPRTDTAAGRDEKQRAAAASAPSQRTSPKRRASSALRTLSSFSRKSITPRVPAAAAARPAALDSAKVAGPPAAAGEYEGGGLTRDRETEMRRRSCDGRDAAAASPQQQQIRKGAAAGEEYVLSAAETGLRPVEGPGPQDSQERGEEEGREGEGEELEAAGERHSSGEGWKQPVSSQSESYSPRRLLYMSVRRGTGGGDSGTPTETAAAAAAPAGGRERGEGTLGSRLKTLGSGGRLHRRGGAGAAARAAEDGGASRPQQSSGAAYGSRKTSHTEGHGDLGAWQRNAAQARGSQQEDGRGDAAASPAAGGREDRGGTGGGGGGATGPLEKLRMSWPRRRRGEEKRSSMVSGGSSSRSSAGSLSPARHASGPARGRGVGGEGGGEEEETAKKGREPAAKGRGRKSSGAGDGKRTFSKSLMSAGSTLLRGATAGVTGTKGRGAAAEAKGEEEGRVPTDEAERGGEGCGGTAAAAARGVTWGEKGRTEGEEWWLGAEERAAEAQMKERMQKQHVKRFTALLYELLEEKESWHIGVDDGPAVRVWSKSGGSSKTAFVFKLAGVVESSLICVLSVLNEQDLFKEWVPYFSFPVRVGLKGCVRLGQFDRVDQMDLVRIAFPWPLSDRDLCLQVWAADDLDVTGQYFVRIASCQAGEDVNGVVAPPSDPGTERLPCEGLLILQPMSADTVDVTALFLIDPHVSLPDYFQSFMTRVFARMAFHAFRRVCAAAQFDEHADRRVMRPYLYSFIDNRVRALEAAQLLFMRTYSSEENRQDGSRSSKSSQRDKSEHADAGAASVSRRVVSYSSSGSSFACPSSPQRSTHRAHSLSMETGTKKQDGNKRGFRG